MPVKPLKLVKPDLLSPSEFRQYKVVCAALFCKYNQESVRYGHVRGSGLKEQYREPDIDVIPHELDCSSFIFYCYIVGGCPEPCPGASSGNGHTGTLWNSGMLVGGPEVKVGRLEPGDVVFFSYDANTPMRGGNSEHVILYLDDGLAASHGSEHGPTIIDWNEGYGKSLVGVRRYRF